MVACISGGAGLKEIRLCLHACLLQISLQCMSMSSKQIFKLAVIRFSDETLNLASHSSLKDMCGTHCCRVGGKGIRDTACLFFCFVCMGPT